MAIGPDRSKRHSRPAAVCACRDNAARNRPALWVRILRARPAIPCSVCGHRTARSRGMPRASSPCTQSEASHLSLQPRSTCDRSTKPKYERHSSKEPLAALRRRPPSPFDPSPEYRTESLSPIGSRFNARRRRFQTSAACAIRGGGSNCYVDSGVMSWSA